MRRVRGRSRDPDSSGRADRRSTPSATVAAARRRSAASGLLARDRRASLGSGALRRLAQRLRAPLADAISRALRHAGSRTSQRAARRTDRREPVSEAASHRRRESLRRALKVHRLSGAEALSHFASGGKGAESAEHPEHAGNTGISLLWLLDARFVMPRRFERWHPARGWARSAGGKGARGRAREQRVDPHPPKTLLCVRCVPCVPRDFGASVWFLDGLVVPNSPGETLRFHRPTAALRPATSTSPVAMPRGDLHHAAVGGVGPRASAGAARGRAIPRDSSGVA